MCFTTKSGDFGIEWRKESDGMPVGGLFRRKADDNESAASAPNGRGGGQSVATGLICMRPGEGTHLSVRWQ